MISVEKSVAFPDRGISQVYFALETNREIAYVGDDLNDLSLLMQAGLACCAGDAQPEVKKISHVISGRDGGNGVVRDIAELILKTQGKWQQLVDAFAGNKSVPNYAQ